MVLGIVLSSISILVSLVSLFYYFFNNKNHKSKIQVDENDVLMYDLGTSKKIFLVVYALSNVGMITLLVLSILNKFQVFDFLMYYILLTLLLLFAIKYLLSEAFEYFVVQNDRILVKKLFRKLKVVLFDDIKQTNINQQAHVVITGHNNQIITSFSYQGHHAKEGIELMHNNGIKFNPDLLKYLKISSVEENKPDNSEVSADTTLQNVETENNKEDEKYTPEQKEAFELIGKQFRENKNINFRNDIIKAIVIQVLVAGAIVLFTLLLGNLLLLILLLVNVYLAYSKSKELKEKYQIEGKSDFDLGLKYAYLNKNVIGYHDGKNRMLKSSSIMIIILLVFFTGFLGYSLFSLKGFTYDKTIPVNGTLNSIDVKNQITFKIDDQEEKYKDVTFSLPNSLYSYIDTAGLENEATSQTVEIKIDQNFVEGTQSAAVYYLKIGDKEYLNLDTINKYYDNYKNRQMVSFYVSLGVTIVAIGFTVGMYYYNKSQIKTETIKITK